MGLIGSAWNRILIVFRVDRINAMWVLRLTREAIVPRVKRNTHIDGNALSRCTGQHIKLDPRSIDRGSSDPHEALKDKPNGSRYQEIPGHIFIVGMASRAFRFPEKPGQRFHNCSTGTGNIVHVCAITHHENQKFPVTTGVTGSDAQPVTVQYYPVPLLQIVKRPVNPFTRDANPRKDAENSWILQQHSEYAMSPRIGSVLGPAEMCRLLKAVQNGALPD